MCRSNLTPGLDRLFKADARVVPGSRPRLGLMFTHVFVRKNYSEHVRTLLIGYRSGGTPGFPQNLRARDGIAGRRRGSSACQRPSDLPALRVASRCSPVGFDRQQLHLLSLHVGNIFFNVALSEFACRGYTIFILQLDKLMLQLLIDMCCCRENIFSGNVA